MHKDDGFSRAREASTGMVGSTNDVPCQKKVQSGLELGAGGRGWGRGFGTRGVTW